MARRHPKIRDTRERLLNAALELFSTQGFAATQVDDIADRAGLTKGAFYYYFHDKDDIGRDLQQQLWEELSEKARRAFDPARDVISNLQAAFVAGLEALRDLGQARFFLRDSWHIPVLEASGRTQQERGIALMRDLLQQGIARNEVVALDPDALAAVVTGIFEEAMLHVLTVGEAGPTVEVVNRFLESLRPGTVAATTTGETRVGQDLVTGGRGVAR